METFETRCHDFWNWFRGVAPHLLSEFFAAEARRDYFELQRITDTIGSRIAVIEPGLSVRASIGTGRVNLEIVSPDAEISARATALAPSVEGWTFGARAQLHNASIFVRDEDGNELRVWYRDVTFAFLPAKPDGTVSVIFAQDGDFDPHGELGHLYKSVADELIRNAFGSKPPGMGSCALFPTKRVAPRESRPVDELAEAWKLRAR